MKKEELTDGTNGNRLLDIEELARFLNVPKSWIYGQTRQTKRTGFPVVKVGKYCRFNREAVMSWLNEQS